jgi:hypothetical protein
MANKQGCSVLAGCKGVRECAEFANSLSQPQLRALKSWRNKKTGKFTAPTANTFWRVAEAMDPIAFEKIANEWFRNEDIDPEAIALDGKTLRGTIPFATRDNLINSIPTFRTLSRTLSQRGII